MRTSPKRDPLDDGEIADGCRANKNATHPDSFWAGVRYAEKTHGIVGWNKERELLKKVWEDLDGDRDNYNMLCDEIEEMLAQPEQSQMTGYDLFQGFLSDDDATHAESYWAGAMLVEKHYGVLRTKITKLCNFARSDS
jgi:hypothetical protein